MGAGGLPGEDVRPAATEPPNDDDVPLQSPACHGPGEADMEPYHSRFEDDEGPDANEVMGKDRLVGCGAAARPLRCEVLYERLQGS